MNLKKWGILVVALVVTYAALVFFAVVPHPLSILTPQNTGPEVTAYASPIHRFAFVYPTTFELRELPLTNQGIAWTAITLADKEILRSAEENGASEGPPLIAVQIFNNIEGVSAEEWARNSLFSNFNLSDGRLGTTTVGGVESVAYIYSGLFTTDVVVTSHNEKIYMFLVDWITEEDENRRTFDRILGSVQFI